jgi:predicted DCC family thiol-disulfide oxidoreductase YuxK
MNLGKALRDHYLRIDARSLGLFRLAFGLVLIGDLFRRFRHLKAFYSNEGVLPNHNHIFNLRETGQVWSVLHAFSSPGENEFAFWWILFFYVCFTIGWHTRAFHVVSLVCLVSLTARNVLLENAGNYAAIAILAFTAFLPLGSRFSLDSLRRSLDARDEKRAKDLNDRWKPGASAIQAARAPGWSATSLAALAVLVQIAVIYVASAMQQSGEAWRDGSAFHYALNSERLASAAGAAARSSLGPGALAAWTRAFHAAEWAIPALIFVPFAWRLTRGVAVGLALFHALTLGIFFSFGLYGWTLAAAAALLVPGETWDRVEGVPDPRRRRTMIYDADCGVCLWLSRLLKRLDLRGNLTFQGNDELEELWVRGKGLAAEKIAMPAAVTADLVQNTVIAVDPRGQVFTRASAVAEVVQALPLGWAIAWAMRLPGIVNLLNLLYDFIATRRQQISVAMGKAACGLEPPPAEGDAEAEGAQGYRSAGSVGHDAIEVAPATRALRFATGSIREVLVAVVFWAMLAQTTHANQLPWKIGQPRALAAVAAWPRMLARWDVLAPEPPREDEVFAVDGQTRGGRSVDPITGLEPAFDPGAMRGTRVGQLWNDYLTRIHQREWFDFQRAFRDYLGKGGPALEGQTGDNQLVGLDAYWIKQRIPEPGKEREPGLSAREKIFTQSRGGRLQMDKVLPLLKPEVINRQPPQKR